MDLLLAIQRDRTLKEVRLEPKTQAKMSAKFEAFEAELAGDNVEVHDYAPGFKPDVGGVVRLEYDLPDQLWRCRQALPNNVSPLDKHALKQSPPTALVAVNVGKAPRFLFQAVDNRNMLSEGGALFFGPKAFRSNDETALIVGHHIDALHAGGHLYFKSEHTVRRFLDISKYFSEATDEEIRTVLESKTFAVDNWDVLLANATIPVRLKLHAVLKSGRALTVPALQKVADRLGKTLKLKNKAIVVPSTSAEFRDFVHLISDDFLESGLEPTVMYLANSKRRLKS